MNFVLLHTGDTMDPDEVKVPKLVDGWVEPAPNTSKWGDNFEKWTTQAGVLDSPTALYLFL